MTDDGCDPVFSYFQCSENNSKVGTKGGEKGVKMLNSLTSRGPGLRMISKTGEVWRLITEPAKGSVVDGKLQAIKRTNLDEQLRVLQGYEKPKAY